MNIAESLAGAFVTALVLHPAIGQAAETTAQVKPVESGEPASEAAEPGESVKPVEAGEAPNEAAETMSGKWGGLRSQLKEKGLQFGINYIGEGLANVSGGAHAGETYLGRLEVIMDADLEKIAGWEGATFHANAFQIHGRGQQADNLHNLMPPSNVEAERTTRLFTLWLQQNLMDDQISLRAGQIAADEEFAVSSYSANLMNGTFGWSALLANDTLSGGPAYPLATPGIRLRVAPSPETSAMVGVFAGDPAGSGSNTDPQQRNRYGTTFSLDGGAFVISELGYAVNQGKEARGLPASYKLGGWYQSGKLSDQRVDSTGQSLASPATSGIAQRDRGDYGLYGVVDQMLWKEPGTADQGLGAFLRVYGAPLGDRNLLDFYFDTGLSYKGLIENRDDDVLAIGVAHGHIGDAARQVTVDSRSLANRPDYPERSSETLVEVSYIAQMTPWWTLQPDVQYIVNPGAGIPKPGQASTEKNALVVGARTTLKF